MITSLLAIPIISGLASFAVRNASEGEDQVQFGKLLLAASIGCLLPFLFLGSFGIWDIRNFSISIFCGLLLLAALVDRETAWAPDELMLPLTALSMVVGVYLGSWDVSILYAVIMGISLFAIFQGMWIFLAKISPNLPLPPPADLLAFLIPFLVIGPNYGTVAFTTTISIFLILCMKISKFYLIFSRPEVVDHVLKTEGLDDIKEQRGMTFLALSFPLLMVFMMLRISSDIL